MSLPAHNITLQASLEYPNIALGLVGSLGEIHEAALAGENGVNPLIPQRVPFEQWINNSEIGGNSTIFAQQPSALWPFVPGLWHAAPLISRFHNNNNNVVTTETSGAVFWSHDAIGPTCEDAAEAIRERICLKNAGMYNCNQEPEEYEAVGGRIFGRYTWKQKDIRGARNAALDNDDPHKLQASIMEQSNSWGPELWLAPVASGSNDYLTTTWPFVREQEAYTLTHTGLVSNTSFVRVFLSEQEYLAARLLTTHVGMGRTNTVAGSNDEASCVAEELAAVQLLVVFTYSAPDHLDDAYVQDVLVSGQPQFQSPALFQQFLTEQQQESLSSSDQAIAIALQSVSLSKQMALMEWTIWRQEDADKLWKNQPSDARYAIHRRLVRILCEIHREDDDNRRFLSILNSRLCECTHNRALVESGILGVQDAGVLHPMIADAQVRHEESDDKYYPYPPSILLESVTSVMGAKAIMEAGVSLQLSVVVKSVGHVDMALLRFLIDELLVHHDHTVLGPLAAAAARSLSMDSLKEVISRMEKSEISDLFDEMFFIDDPPPDDNKYTAPSEPPESKGTLRQVAAGALIRGWFSYEKYLYSVEYSARRNAQAEASGSGTRTTFVAPREPFDVNQFVEMVMFMEHIAPQEGQPSQILQAYTPNDNFENRFIRFERYDQGYIESTGTTVEALLESAKRKLSETLVEIYPKAVQSAIWVSVSLPTQTKQKRNATF